MSTDNKLSNLEGARKALRESTSSTVKDTLKLLLWDLEDYTEEVCLHAFRYARQCERYSVAFKAYFECTTESELLKHQAEDLLMDESIDAETLRKTFWRQRPSEKGARYLDLLRLLELRNIANPVGFEKNIAIPALTKMLTEKYNTSFKLGRDRWASGIRSNAFSAVVNNRCIKAFATAIELDHCVVFGWRMKQQILGRFEWEALDWGLEKGLTNP